MMTDGIPRFREWYEARHDRYPGNTGEHYSRLFERLTNAFADYVDEVVDTMKKAAE